MTLSANNIIGSLIPYMDDIEACRREVPRGSYIWEGSPYKPLYDNSHSAEQAINLVNDVTGISIPALYAMTLAARRWYTRTEWRRCLPTEDAQWLMRCMVAQYPNKR